MADRAVMAECMADRADMAESMADRSLVSALEHGRHGREHGRAPVTIERMAERHFQLLRVADIFTCELAAQMSLNKFKYIQISPNQINVYIQYADIQYIYLDLISMLTQFG